MNGGPRAATSPSWVGARAALVALLAAAGSALAQEPPAGPPRPGPAPVERTLDVNEYRVTGASRMPEADLQRVLEPFLGPGRVLSDVERARAALEKAYADRGYQAVTVGVPQQTVRDGVVTLEVTEGRVARLRVQGARWFLPSEIRRLAPSVVEGNVPNFEEIVRDIFVLNQLPDRRVVPSLRAGVAPGTIVVDLDVEDHLPLHGSLEVNDRFSAGTTPTRLNASLRYDNLFQLGHALSLSFQTAPERTSDGLVYTASYLARFPGLTWFSLTASGVVQDSDVSTLGGVAVTGRGRIAGLKATFTAAATSSLFATVAVGVDYKNFLEGIALDQNRLRAPIEYWPLTAQLASTWQRETTRTQLTATTVLALRALGSSPRSFDAKRYRASGSFAFGRLELARENELPLGFAVSARLQGQLSPGPLVGPEQLACGGAESVRGYVEARAVGDYGVSGQLELRGPSLGRLLGVAFLDAWRAHVFADGGVTGLHDPLPEQQKRFTLASAGAGARVEAWGHLGGAVDLGVPLRAVGDTRRFEPRLHFRVWSQF